MKFNFEEILILIVAFLIGWFSRTIIQKNFIEGALPTCDDLNKIYNEELQEEIKKLKKKWDEATDKSCKISTTGMDLFGYNTEEDEDGEEDKDG